MSKFEDGEYDLYFIYYFWGTKALYFIYCNVIYKLTKYYSTFVEVNNNWYGIMRDNFR